MRRPQARLPPQARTGLRVRRRAPLRASRLPARRPAARLQEPPRRVPPGLRPRPGPLPRQPAQARPQVLRPGALPPEALQRELRLPAQVRRVLPAFRPAVPRVPVRALPAAPRWERAAARRRAPRPARLPLPGRHPVQPELRPQVPRPAAAIPRPARRGWLPPPARKRRWALRGLSRPPARRHRRTCRSCYFSACK